MVQADRNATQRGLTSEEPQFGLVVQMEDLILAIQNYATALSLIGETMEEREGMATCQLARDILSNLEELEEKRCELFKRHHPDRQRFEREGWPGEEVAA